MKTVTILILTFLLSPWTVHAYDKGKETPVIETLKSVQMETRDRQAFEQTAVLPDTTNKQELLKRVKERVYLSVIITYKMEDYSNERELNENQSRAQRSQIAQMHNDFVRELENVDFTYQIGRKLNLRPRISITVDKKGLKYLYDLQSIESIIENKSVPRHLAESTSIITSDDVNDFLNVHGEERKIFIIDDGIDYGHSAFSGRVADGACFSTTDALRNISSLCHNGADFDIGFEAGKPCDDSNVDCEHGTHVAGIAAGNNGVAPEANIIPLLAYSKHENAADCSPESAPCGAYQTIDLEASLEYVYQNYLNNGLSVINMSLGGGEFSSTCDNEPLKNIIEDLLFEDIITVASSGNRNYDNALSWPACISDVISVGATDKQDAHWTESDTVGSNAASFLDLVAPGVGIDSAVPGGSTASFTGTSQAAPHVAGTIALMVQAAPAPFLPPSTVRSILQSTADEVPGMFPNSFTDEYGHGRLNAFDAVVEALKINPSVTVVYDFDLTIPPGETHNYIDEAIYVLEGTTFTVNGNLWLEDTNLYVLGTLEGTGRIDTVGTSQIITAGNGNNNFEGEYGDGTEPPIPTYTDTTFTVSTTLTETAIYTGTTTIEPGVVVTVNDGIEITMEGAVVMEESGSDYGEIYVPGFLNIDDQCQVYNGKLHAPQNGKIQVGNNVTTISTRKKVSSGGEMLLGDDITLKYENDTILEVENGGLLETGSDNTMELNSQLLLFEGDVILGSGFTMKDGIMDIGETGNAEFEGSALLEFIEVPVSSMPGGPTLYMVPRMNIRGIFTSPLPQNITMRLSSGSTYSEWNGITVYNSSKRSKIWGLTIEDAKTGIHLSSVDSISLSNVVIDSPSEAGLVSMGSNPLASGVDVINSSGIGVDISGGNPEIGYFDATGNSESGVRSRSYASTYMPEGSVSGSGAGPSYAGVWVENASHTHINGTIGSVSGWQAAAVNDAWAYFNGTTWGGGTPYTYVDGSSQLYVYNPNNPQKARGGQERLQAQLLREWAERYREDSGEAVSWLMSERPSMAETQQAVASILLADHFIASREFSQAKTILTESSAKNHRDLVAPDAFAQREVLLARISHQEIYLSARRR